MGRIPETHACNRKSSKCRDTGYAGRGTVFDGKNFRSLSGSWSGGKSFFIRRTGMAGEQCGRVFDLHTDAGFRWRIPCIYYR